MALYDQITQFPYQFVTLILAFILAFLIWQGPSGPSRPEPIPQADCGGSQYELPFEDARLVAYQSPHGPLWRQTPCGRTTHIRAWSDLH